MYHYISRVLIILILIFAISCSISDNNDLGYKYKILFMVYMAGDNNLDQFALSDINEMESVNLKNSDVKIIVLLDRGESGEWSDTKMYDIGFDSNPNSITSSEVSTNFTNVESNTGDPELLKSFLEYSTSNFKAKYNSLVIWNHGEGIAGCCYDQTDGDTLTLKELDRALDGYYLNSICFDACSMGMIEVCYELRTRSQYIVFSQEDVPSSGWDYSSVLSKFKNVDLNSSSIILSIIDSYRYQTISAVETEYIPEAVSSLNLLLDTIKSEDLNFFKLKRDDLMDFNNKNQVDILQLFSLLKPSTEYICFSDKIKKLVVLQKNQKEYSDLCGISIFYPREFYDYNLPIYSQENLTFCRDTTWMKDIFKIHTNM